jgi:Xaa-Pro aminopeptidase
MARKPIPEYITARLREARKRLKAVKADALLIKNEVDYFYLTSFTGADSAAIITPRDVHILTDGRFLEEIKHEVAWAKVWVRKGGLNEEIGKACADVKLKRLAIQPEHVTLADQADIKKRAKGVRLISARPIVSQMRKLKDEDELAAMNRAIRVAEDGFRVMRQTIQVGQSELQIAARLEFEMKRLGASGPSFNTICAEGPNAAMPHAVPGRRKIKKGSSILIDWGARVAGYNSDLTRVLFVGSIPPKIRQIYDIALEAQLAAIQAIAPGRRMCDVDEVARKIIADAGFGEQFTHGLGHGLGLEVHEAPSLSWRSQEELVAGMVVTVEPGIYLPGVGGVRIEDDVLVTARGRRVLTHLEKSLEASII